MDTDDSSQSSSAKGGQPETEEELEAREISFKPVDTYDVQKLPSDIFVYRCIQTGSRDFKPPNISFLWVFAFILIQAFSKWSLLALIPFSGYVLYHSIVTGKSTVFTVRATTTYYGPETDSRPLPDRSRVALLGDLYTLCYYVQIDNRLKFLRVGPTTIATDVLKEDYPEIYKRLKECGLIQDLLVESDVISSSHYNELVTRKTVNATDPGLSTLASRCDYLSMAPDLLLQDGVSVARCTVKVASCQITSVSTPIFRAKTTSLLISMATEFMMQASPQGMRRSRKGSWCGLRYQGMPIGLWLLLLLLFIAILTACIVLIPRTQSTYLQAVPKGSHSGPRPASAVSDAVSGDSPNYSSSSYKLEDSYPPSQTQVIYHSQPGFPPPDTQSSAKSSLKVPITEMEFERLQQQRAQAELAKMRVSLQRQTLRARAARQHMEFAMAREIRRSQEDGEGTN